MLYDKKTKIVSFNEIDVFPYYKNDTGIKAVIYIRPSDFYELEGFHLANIRKGNASFSFGAYFPNESVFVYDFSGNIIDNVGALDILKHYEYINVTASFKIIQVEDGIKGISYPIISGHELRIYVT